MLQVPAYDLHEAVFGSIRLRVTACSGTQTIESFGFCNGL